MQKKERKIFFSFLFDSKFIFLSFPSVSHHRTRQNHKSYLSSIMKRVMNCLQQVETITFPIIKTMIYSFICLHLSVFLKGMNLPRNFSLLPQHSFSKCLNGGVIYIVACLTTSLFSQLRTELCDGEIIIINLVVYFAVLFG